MVSGVSPAMGDLQGVKRYKPSTDDERTGGEEAPFDLHPLFFHCARLILPWLTPPELASISLSCKTLHRVSQSITAARSADASRSLERFPIPFINAVDRTPYAYFIYTPTSQIPHNPQSHPPQPWGPNCHPVPGQAIGGAGGIGFGCDCERCERQVGEDGGGGGGGAISCPCDFGLESGEVMNECGPTCGCGSECGNRVTQGGVSVRLKIVRDLSKGWGLYAAEFILYGQFVCEYAGELLTSREARRRQEIYDKASSSGRQSSALLVVREHLPSRAACMRINIDATRVGNIARFINHSCDGGNLSTRIVRSSGVLLPRLCFFATRDIKENEELTFSYGLDRLKPEGLRCFCGSSCCFGYLPSENT